MTNSPYRDGASNLEIENSILKEKCATLSEALKTLQDEHYKVLQENLELVKRTAVVPVVSEEFEYKTYYCAASLLRDVNFTQSFPGWEIFNTCQGSPAFIAIFFRRKVIKTSKP